MQPTRLSSVTSHLRAVGDLMRVDRPVGWLLLLWPTLAALWLSAEATPPIWIIWVFAVGCVVMRTAGCIANDIADRNFDSQVERTKNRPLADGRLGVPEALTWLAVLLAAALALALTLDPVSRWLALGGLAIALTYPLFKRRTHFPQVVLGIAFSWGILMASTATIGHIPETVWLLFSGSFCWIVAYDTEYAMVDRVDDLTIGLKSTAILFGKRDRALIGVLQAAALAFWGSLLFIGPLGFGYALSMAVAVAVFVLQQRLISDRDRKKCFRAFGTNVWVGLALFFGVVVDVAT